MDNILFIALSAVICGAETWGEIESFGQRKKEWLSSCIELSNGIPSHDTFNRFFSSLNPDAFEKAFRQWVTSIIPASTGDIISLDGKTIRGSRGFMRSPLHVVSAWSSDNRMALAQLRTSEKSNEITAILNS